MSDIIMMLNIQLLAHVFNRAWRHAFALSQVCKRFSLMVRRPEFWMPGVKRELAQRLRDAPLVMRDAVNPFYEFPKHVWLCPDLEHWGQWLCWMFEGRYCFHHLSFKHYQSGWKIIVLRYEVGGKTHTDVKELKFGWFNDVTNIVVSHQHKDRMPHYVCSKTTYPETRYMVILEDRVVWVDSSVREKHRDNVALWCGAVRGKVGDKDLVPVLGAGYWKTSENKE